MLALQVALCVAACLVMANASTTVIPRPPRFLRHPGMEETTSELVVAAPELTAATPSDQPKQIPPPPAPRHYLRATTPGYEAPPPHLRLLWAPEGGSVNLYTPQPTQSYVQ
jgi:hypothetical protein